MSDVWALRTAGLVAAMGTAAFVALMAFRGPVQGPTVDVAVMGAALSVVLLVASVRAGENPGL